MSASESPAHLELKRLALIWAQANGYPIAACEVSLPNLRFRLDVGAYRPSSRREVKRDARLNTNRAVLAAAIGVTAVFECKASRPDLVRDCRSAARLIERMKVLTERRLTLELRVRPEWRDVEEATRLTFLHRLAAAGTKATNREAGVAFLAIESERRGIDPLNSAKAASTGLKEVPVQPAATEAKK